MIRAVLFDYGGVLSANGQHGGLQRALAKVFGIDEAALDVGALHHLLRVGEINDAVFFDELNRRYSNGQAKLTKELLHRMNAIVEPSPKVYALAAALRTHGIKTGILSNIYAVTAEFLREHGCYDGFDPVVLSCEERAAKPDPLLYRIALQRLDEPASNVLLIDDQTKCLPPAQTLGMHTILAEHPEQIVAATQRLLKAENNLDLAV